MHIQTCWQCGAKNQISDEGPGGGAHACERCGAELPTADNLQVEQPPPARPDDLELEVGAPLGLAERFKYFFCTYALLAVNLVVFVLMIASGVHIMEPTTQSLFDWGADFGPASVGPEPWRLLASMFIHIGVIHLALNMYVLSDVGPLAERLYGRAGFLALYLLSGVGGSLVSICWKPAIVSAGASGAVFGLFGGLLGLLLTRRDSFPSDFVRRHTTSIIGFLAYNVFFGMTHPSINNAAHLGGLATGFVIALALNPDMTARRKWGARQSVGIVLVLMLLGGAAFAARRRAGESPEARLLGTVYSSQKLAVKPGKEIYFSNGATREEAQTLAQGLEAKGFFKEPGDAAVLLSKGGGGFEVSYIPRKEAFDGPNVDRMFELQATDLSADVFGGRPVTLTLCDEYLEPLKTVRSGSKITLRENQAIYYRGEATEGEARALGEALRAGRFVGDEGGAHIELSKASGGFEVFFIVKDGTWDNPDAVERFEGLAAQLSAQVFGQQPVTIHLCDGELTTRKTVKQ